MTKLLVYRFAIYYLLSIVLNILCVTAFDITIDVSGSVWYVLHCSTVVLGNISRIMMMSDVHKHSIFDQILQL